MCLFAYPWSPGSQRAKENPSDLRRMYELNARIDLLGFVTGNDYKLVAYCGKCGRSLSTSEIHKGFVDDPDDKRTECLRCNTRFNAELFLSSSDTKVKLTLLSPAATLAALPVKEDCSPADLCQRDMSVYHSALYHFGSLQNAYLEVGLKYPHVEKFADWERHSVGFLGRVPDGLIATVAGVTVWQVRKLRKAFKKPSFAYYPACEYTPVQVE